MLLRALFILCALFVIACGDDSDSTETMAGEETMALAIVGEYEDDYMTAHIITNETWTQTYPGGMPSIFHIRSVNQDALYLIAENDETNEYNPSLWSRMDWTYNNDELWYCQVTFDAESAELAEASEAPDASDPSASGCGDFPWSKLNLQ